MNRRQLFLSSAKAALATALGAVGFRTAAQRAVADSGRIPRQQGAADPDAALQRLHRTELRRQQAGLAADRHAARRRAERAPGPDRRCGLRLQLGVRRPRADADGGQVGGARPALHPDAQHGALLADPGRAAHRPKSPRGRLRHGGRRIDRLSRLRLHHGPETAHGALAAEGERLLHRLVRQEPQRPGLGGEPAGTVHSLADRTGLRLFLRLRRRRLQPVGAGLPVPQHDADSPLHGEARRVEPDHGDGG